MLIQILIDTVIIWYLLKHFSDFNWIDEKGTVFGITLCIVVFGGLGTGMFAEQLGYLALGVYVLIGGMIFRFMADMTWKNAFKAMGVFLGIKIALALILTSDVQ